MNEGYEMDAIMKATLVDMALNMLGERYVVTRDPGKKVFAAVPRPTYDAHNIRLFYPPRAHSGDLMPIDVSVSADEARAMIGVLQNAIDWHETGEGAGSASTVSDDPFADLF